MMKNRRLSAPGIKKSFSPLLITLFVLMSLYALSLIIPLVWAFITSLRHHSDFYDSMFGLPNPPTIINYAYAYVHFSYQFTNEFGRQTIMFPELVSNTVVYALGCALMQTVTPYVMAYLVARFKSKFSSLIMSIVLICMTIPVVGTLPSELAMAHSLGIHDTFWGMFIMRANFLGMYFLVYVAAIKAISPSFAESAKIDGANNFQILCRIYIPMNINTMFTVYLIKFIEYWNEYQVPMLYLPSYPTMSLALNQLLVNSNNQYMSYWVRKLAACMIVFIPIFILFVIFNKRIMGNISMGGVKE